MKTVLVTGGTGLVGTALSKLLLTRGYSVIILTRDPALKNQENTNPLIEYARWNIKTQEIDESCIEKADYIIHLAGAGVFEKNWTPGYKKEIVESRTRSSQLIISSLQKIPNKVKAVISSSAVGWYGADKINSLPFTETDKADTNFLGDTCRQWEESISPAENMNIRLVKLRTGIVLSNAGGAFPEFKRPVNMGVAAITGSGEQMISWIHIEDLCRMYIKAMEDDQITGVYNAVAPAPVSNRLLMLQLARHMRGKFFIPVHIPAFLLKMVLGEKSIEILKSAHVSCAKIKQTGFTFLYPTIEAAIQNLLASNVL